MKKVSIITSVDFWRQGSGHRARILALANYLSKNTRLTVIYLGVQKPKDQHLINAFQFKFKIFFLDKNRILSLPEYIERFVIYLNSHSVEICIIEYIELSFLLNYIPKNIKVILDTHDIKSDRQKSFDYFGYQFEEFSWMKELEIYKKYDAVILIQEDDYDKVCKYLGSEKAILAPHPVVFPKRFIRENVSNIGFIGSEYLPNTDGIVWFLEMVWPYVYRDNLSLNIYGKVIHTFNHNCYKGIVGHGFIPKLNKIYEKIDIMINPVRFGAGLKIKNVEALGNGIPLVTTSHSAKGLTNVKDKAFLIADDANSFIDSLNQLINNYEKRFALGIEAYKFIKTNFSPEKCFNNLLQLIYS